MKSSRVPAKMRPGKWHGCLFPAALGVDDDPFPHFLLVDMVWKGIFIDLGPENKFDAFLPIRLFSLALTSDFRSRASCSACLFILLQNVGGQSTRQATVFLWEEWGIIDSWHPWPGARTLRQVQAWT